MTENLKVFLFGRFRIQLGNEILKWRSSVKSQELLCYLLLNRNRSHFRETLASILWDNVSTSQSKQYLRRALWQCQSTLSNWMPSSPKTVILTEGDWIRINPDVDLWVDANYFYATCTQVQGISDKELDIETRRQLCEAVHLYRDSLLEGWYQDWCLFERERYRHLLLNSLDKLMLYSECAGEYEMGIAYGTRILQLDQAREHTHRRLMRLYYLLGNRTDALRQYDKCQLVLHEELGIQPDQTTTDLYEEFRCANSSTILKPDTLRNRPLPQSNNSSAKKQSDLQQINGSLLNIQKQLQKLNQAVEIILHQNE